MTKTWKITAFIIAILLVCNKYCNSQINTSNAPNYEADSLNNNNSNLKISYSDDSTWYYHNLIQDYLNADYVALVTVNKTIIIDTIGPYTGQDIQAYSDFKKRWNDE